MGIQRKLKFYLDKITNMPYNQNMVTSYNISGVSSSEINKKTIFLNRAFDFYSNAFFIFSRQFINIFLLKPNLLNWVFCLKRVTKMSKKVRIKRSIRKIKQGLEVKNSMPDQTGTRALAYFF